MATTPAAASVAAAGLDCVFLVDVDVTGVVVVGVSEYAGEILSIGKVTPSRDAPAVLAFGITFGILGAALDFEAAALLALKGGEVTIVYDEAGEGGSSGA